LQGWERDSVEDQRDFVRFGALTPIVVNLYLAQLGLFLGCVLALWVGNDRLHFRGSR